jgi:methylglutaconyl-CoA hydratase
VATRHYPPTKTGPASLQHSSPDHSLNDFVGLFNRITKLTMPTIAAIDGPALGGGLELALVRHTVAVHDVDKIALPGCRIGIIPGAGGTQRLPRLIGVARAKELIFMGRSLDAQQALDWVLCPFVPSNRPTDSSDW